MDCQLGLNPDWCACPSWKKTTICALLFVFHFYPFLKCFSPSYEVTKWRREFVLFFFRRPGFHLHHKKSLTVPSSSSLSLCLTGCWADWLVGSLSHWSLTTGSSSAWASLRQRQTLGLLKAWRAQHFSFSIRFGEKIKCNQRKSLSPQAQTTDHPSCAASMTLSTWPGYGFGFILIWMFCLTQGEWSTLKNDHCAEI